MLCIEIADSLAKESVNNNEINVNVALGRVGLREIIKESIMTEWQRLWLNDSTGRHYYSFQPQLKSVTVMVTEGPKGLATADQINTYML